MTNYKTLEELIKQVLIKHTETRSSDWDLFFRIFEYKGLYLTESYKSRIRQMPLPDSILRLKRKLPNLAPVEVERTLI